MRLGLGYVKGLPQARCGGDRWPRARTDGLFASAEDLAQRVPSLNAQRTDAAGADRRAESTRRHPPPPRRALAGGARGQAGGPAAAPAERVAARRIGDAALAADECGRAPGGGLCRNRPHRGQASHGISPRGAAPRQHPLGRRSSRHAAHGEFVRAAGCVIARQRPGTAKGFIFISMEDETGIANVIVTPDLYERDRLVVTRSRFLLVEGPLQNQDNVIHVKATRLDRALRCGARIALARFSLSAASRYNPDNSGCIAGTP